MKRILTNRISILALAALLVSPAPLFAQGKVLTIDLPKVFDNYYKTKQISAAIKDQAAEYNKEGKQMEDKFNKLRDEYNDLKDKANDQAVSEDERKKAKDALQKKYSDLRDASDGLDQFQRDASARLKAKEDSEREKILKELRAVIEAKAKSANGALVIDIAAVTYDRTPVILFSSGENDITEAVLAQVNAAAPAFAAKTEPVATTNTPARATPPANKK